MQGSQGPDYLSFDDMGGGREESARYIFMSGRIFLPLTSDLLIFNFRLGHFISHSFDT